jgi:4-hydroxybenzoate polyprenyltransferase
LLFKVSRPLGWIIGPLIFLMGFREANAVFSPIALAEIILLTFPFCVLLYGINDIYDYESDRINPRKKNVEGIKLQLPDHSFVRKASLVSAFLLVLASIFTFSIFNISAMLVLLFFLLLLFRPAAAFQGKATSGFIIQWSDLFSMPLSARL